jgi:hypothetical protein
MRRRDVITILGGAVTWPLAARAQQPDRIRLVGVLMSFAESDPTAQSMVAAFRGALLMTHSRQWAADFGVLHNRASHSTMW